MAANVTNPENDNIVAATKRALSHLKTPIQKHFLKSFGLAHHDIRVFTESEPPIRIERYHILGEHNFYVDVPGVKFVKANKLKLVCCSNTKPSILSIHLFIDWLDDSDNTFIKGSLNSPEEGKGWVWSIDYLHNMAKPDALGQYAIPVLGDGRVLELRLGNCQSITYRKASEWAKHTGFTEHEAVNHLDSKNDNKRKSLYLGSKEAFNKIFDKVNITLVVILDNEESLPYKWNNSEGRFSPGFNTIGLV